MCGIAGIINLYENHDYDKNLIVHMCDALKHRGPDGEGFLYPSTFSFQDFENLRARRPKAQIHAGSWKRPVILGHRRLSIIDLNSNASQPMCDDTEKIWIVLNGEIYNHRLLRKQLEEIGHQFKTDHSDTESLLHAYKEWGVDCLKHLHGMYAFAIWDSEKDFVFLARDRMGVKPLYYSIHNQQFIFGSEIKALLQKKSIERKINYTALNELLTYNSVAAPNTLYQGIYKLQAAHYITIEKGIISEQKRYWNLHSNSTTEIHTEEKAIQEIQQTLHRSVQLRMETDVPYGALLSGGVDSSANVMHLSKESKHALHTFSFGFKSSDGFCRNEYAYADEVAKLCNTQHHKVEISDADFYSFLQTYQFHFDEPIVDTASIPLYFLAKEAHTNNLKILLGGEGCDELFMGYQLWRFNYQFNQLIATKSTFFKRLFLLFLQLPVLRNKRPFYRNWLHKLIHNHLIFTGGTEVITDNQKVKYYTDSFKRKAELDKCYTLIENHYKEFQKESSDWGKWMTYLDTKIRLPELLLARLDKMTMMVSVEAREPFIDYKLAELSYHIDTRLKIKNNTEKYILKKSLEGFLPHHIIHRKKDGFTIPLDKLFENEKLRKHAFEKINEFNNYEQVFSATYINKLWNENLYARLWQLYMVALWWDNYIMNVPVFVDEVGKLIPKHL